MITEKFKTENQSKIDDEYLVPVIEFIINTDDTRNPVYGELRVCHNNGMLEEATITISHYEGDDQGVIDFALSDVKSHLMQLYHNRYNWNGVWETCIDGYNVRACKCSPSIDKED